MANTSSGLGWCKFFQRSWLWVMRKPKAEFLVSIWAEEVFWEEGKELHFKSVLDGGEAIIPLASKRNYCRKMQPALKLLNSAEISCLSEGNAHEHSTTKTHAALWSLYGFFLKGKCSKAICCSWGSVGSVTKGRHGAKNFWALPGTYWSPQLPWKAGMVFLDLIRNLWHLAKLKSLALVCTVG